MAKFKSTHPGGKIADRMNWGETDKETRGSDRKSVTILPARRTIINVYQLMEKLQGKGGKSGGRPTSGNATKSNRVRKTIYHYEDTDVYSGDVDGTRINQHGLPMKKEGEVASQYNPRTFKFISDQIKKGNHDYDKWKSSSGNTSQNTNTKKRAKEEEASAEEERQRNVRAENLRAQEEAKQRMRDAHKTDPVWMLWDIVKKKENRVPIILSQGQLDPKYSYSEMSDPESDYAVIKSSIEEGKKIPSGQPPLVVALARSLHDPPQTYFIRNVSMRRKKPISSKLKRHMAKPAPRKIKRKVVMKRKGGKR